MGTDHKCDKSYAHMLYILQLQEPHQNMQYTIVYETRAPNFIIP